jgi:hypothetical protein
MTVRRRLEVTQETIQVFELALEDRYLEAIELVSRGYPHAGLYLLGYVAEMILKSACMRVTGATAADEVEARLGPARAAGKRLIPKIAHEQYHSLRFWGYLLVAERVSRQRPLRRAVRRAVLRIVERLYADWWVEMRYRADTVEPGEVQNTIRDVDWLLENRVSLWR